MQIRKLLSFEKSPTIILMLIWATMMLTYYLADAPIGKGVVERLCDGRTWMSEAHSLAIFTALAMSLTSALVMIFFGKHATPDRPLKPPAVRKFVAALLSASLILFLSYGFLPCTSALGGTGATSSARAGLALMRIGQMFFPIYAAIHALMLFGVYWALVTAVEDLRHPPEPLGR